MLSDPEIRIILRASLAALLGMLIGWERRAGGAPVRGRSITLATMTSASLTALCVEFYPSEAPRVVAGIVTGIGFLGAGMIVRTTTGEVRGHTTAAGIWTMGLIGITVGAGFPMLGIILTLMAYMIMAWDEWPIIARLNQRRAMRRAMDAENQPTNETDTPTV